MKFRWDKKYLYWGVTALLVIIGGISFYYLIFHNNTLRSNLTKILRILMPIIDGLILAYLLCPILNFIERKLLSPCAGKLMQRFPKLLKKEKRIRRACRGISIVMTLAFVIMLIYCFFQIVIPQLAVSIQNIMQQFPVYVANLTEWSRKILADNPDIEEAISNLINTYSKDMQNWMDTIFVPRMNSLLKTVSLSMLSLAKALWNLVIGLIISIYLMGNKEKLIGQAKKMAYAFLSPARANALIDDARLIDRTFGGFISGKILDSVIIGLLCFICVSFMKLPYPMLISVIVGVTNIIPFFGPYIGAIPSALLVLMVNPIQCLYFIIFILILQQFDGNFLGPRILGDSTGLSGFWVIFAITIFSGFMGVTGMILGVPIFAVFYALLKRKTNKNLNRKGMPEETYRYMNLAKVDTKTGEFYEKRDMNPDNGQEENISSFKKTLKSIFKKSDAEENETEEMNKEENIKK